MKATSKFTYSDSVFVDGPIDSSELDAASSSDVRDNVIGEIIRQRRQLSDEQIAQIVKYQHTNKVRFGEAAVALRLATNEDVLLALSKQYQYAFNPEAGKTENTPGELVLLRNPFSDEAETFRDLRSQLMLGALNTTEARRALSVVSPDVGDGKTFISANLAIAFAQLGGRTLLVDADMRTPRLHKLFDINPSSGLSNILSGRTEKKAIHQIPDLPSLFILPVGGVPPNPLELVQRPTFSLLIDELLSKFDYVIVDTPAAVHGSDARVVAAKCGAAMVVGRRGSTRLPALNSLLNSLKRSSTKVAGVVLNER
jgi:protein-tyrosine kinase